MRIYERVVHQMLRYAHEIVLESERKKNLKIENIIKVNMTLNAHLANTTPQIMATIIPTSLSIQPIAGNNTTSSSNIISLFSLSLDIADKNQICTK